ncbi:MAG: hypothetical protein KDC95_11610 [Planctomycetes bacterium]|nr:hypothetical protein [Planctomycetota bacterium]
MQLLRGTIALGLLVASTSVLPSLPAQDMLPGEVFREYVWKPNGAWARCTGEDATMSGAFAFLPNPVNYVNILDLQDATHVDVIIEKLMSHVGTNNPRVRVNYNNWFSIPEPDTKNIPGQVGEGNLNPYWYLSMRYPAVRIPVGHFKTGTNSFEFKCDGKGGQDLGAVWPQFIYYGVTFRVYYNASKKAHPVGAVISPRPGTSLGRVSPEKIPFEAVYGHTSNGTVTRVDFIGNYNDFNYRGGGRYGNFKFRYEFGELKNHIGKAQLNGKTATAAWDATWIPQQEYPFTVFARITDSTGLSFITPYVGGLELRRAFTVRRYQQNFIPKKWQTRYHSPNHYATTVISDDVSKATAARLYMATWNGYEAEGMNLNGNQFRYNIGFNHNLSYDYVDVNKDWVRTGTNTIHTHSTTIHHGLEVQWPGIEIFVRYGYPETYASTASYGVGCKGANGFPTISAPSRPILGQAFSVDLAGGRANSPVGLLGGLSNTKYGLLDLPLPLATIGAAGCTLFNSADFVTPAVSDGSGAARISVRVPTDRQLLGITFYNQWVVKDASMNRLGAILSNGLRVSIGDY